MSSYLIGVDEEELAEAMLLEELELIIYIGSNDTFAYVTMFEDEQLRDAAMLVWEDGCLDFGDKRGLYKAKFEIETGFEGEPYHAFALYFSEFNRIDLEL